MKLFDRPKARKAIDIVLWWEIRRLLYNVIMIGVGLSSFFIVGFVTIPIVYMMIVSA